MQKEKDHDQIIGYDDVKQLFWYTEGIARIVFADKVCRGLRVGVLSVLKSYAFCRPPSIATVRQVRQGQLEPRSLHDALLLGAFLQPFVFHARSSLSSRSRRP